MTASENQIVVYQPNETVRLDVRLENETVWLNQSRLAELFGVERTVVNHYIHNIYETGELEELATCAKIAQVQNETPSVLLPPPRMVLWRTSWLHEDGRRPNPPDQGRRILAKLIWYNIRHEMTSGRMNDKTTDCSQLERDQHRLGGRTNGGKIIEGYV